LIWPKSFARSWQHCKENSFQFHPHQNPHLRTPNPEFNPGFTPCICYLKGGMGWSRVKPEVWRPEIWAQSSFSHTYRWLLPSRWSFMLFSSPAQGTNTQLYQPEIDAIMYSECGWLGDINISAHARDCRATECN
jgi:hypothetical protein